MQRETGGGNAKSAGQHLIEYAKGPQSEIRTRYDYASFEEEALYCGIYDEMFDADNIESLSRFIGIASRPDYREKKVNITGRQPDIGPAVAGEVARHYRDVYEFAARRFPQTERLWEGFKHL